MKPADRIGALLAAIGGRWTIAVLFELRHEGRRYHELNGALDGISHKVLTDTLRRAEQDGLIERLVDPGRVETVTLYQLSELGRSLSEPVAAFERWVDDHWADVDAARRRWSRRNG